MKYRKKPVVIEAEQLTKSNGVVNQIRLWIADNGGASYVAFDGSGLVIPTLEGDMLASWGDYIIKGVDGEFYPCKPAIFEKTYEETE